MRSEDADSLVEILAAAVAGGSSELEHDGWKFVGVSNRFIMRTHLPVLRFEREGHALCFIVAPSDRSQPAFKRTACFDISYFSEDVPDDQQAEIFRRDRAQIERVASWLVRWDA